MKDLLPNSTRIRNKVFTLGIILVLILLLGQSFMPTYAQLREPLAWSLVDNFNSLSNGDIDGKNGWNAEPGMGTVSDDPTGGSNKVLRITNQDDEYARKVMPSSILDGNTGTLFFRMYRTSGIDSFAGATDDSGASSFSDFEVQIGSRPADGNDWTIRNGGGFQQSTHSNGFPTNTWMCVWLRIDNSSDTFEVFVNGGPYTSRTQLSTSSGSRFSFRNGQSNNSINTFYTMQGLPGGNMYLDDIHIDSASSNLNAPAGVSCSDEAEVGITDMVITGPTTGQTGIEYEFDIEVLPINVTTPIVYSVETTDFAPISAELLSRLATYRATWEIGGTKTIRITAGNGVNSRTESFQIFIQGPTPTSTPSPSLTPTSSPTFAPSLTPTSSPTFAPSLTPTSSPTYTPTPIPTFTPAAPETTEQTIYLPNMLRSFSPCLSVDIEDINDKSATAAKLHSVCSDNRVINGFIETADPIEFDLFRLRVTSPKLFTIKMTNLNPNNDFKLVLYNSEFSELGEELEKTISTTNPLPNGTYFIGIYSVKGSGNYTLTVAER